MSYIIMGTDECGDEFRADDKNYPTKAEAIRNIDAAFNNYQEARNIWIEELRDKGYYQEQYNQAEFYQDEYGDICGLDD